MTKEEMLKKIYKEIADKTLSFGCKIKLFGSETEYTIGEKGHNDTAEEPYEIDKDGYMQYDGFDNFGPIFKYNIKIEEIIGSKVMVGDVLDWLEENPYQQECPNCGEDVGEEEGQMSFPETGQWDIAPDKYCAVCEWSERYNDMGKNLDYIIPEFTINELWEEKRKSIEDQSDYCIGFIYQLIT